MRRGGRALSLGLALLALTPALGPAETLGEVYRRVNPSVVVIRARGQEVTVEGTQRFREIGSGVLISADGKIATAAHVVHSMNEVEVEFLGEDPVPARVIASEPRADISIIQASVVPPDAVVSKLADSDPIRVGDPVFVVGAPYGLSHSLSAGIISARWDADTVTRDFPLAEFFQTTAPINTGNSGGPMFTATGTGRALAVKIDDGELRGLHAVVVALLERLGWLTADEARSLERWKSPRLENWAGRATGRLEVAL